MSCCIMSPHLFFCRPQLWRPLTFAIIILFVYCSIAESSSNMRRNATYHLELYVVLIYYLVILEFTVELYRYRF